ncbi:hypothetical protein N4T20_02335 [Flavobacterium sp. TR2]|uniref:hypothetical protein n=1 Tax=Flavobacterium sp. TR2 TaxID=2977321 RepID=UPI0021B151B5|nr:hypothetical protein [Flavobacterium sp. TR2]UWY28768.1 hypothetical protein N4T20_02335 [Flavobacterium sp. TR2]
MEKRKKALLLHPQRRKMLLEIPAASEDQRKEIFEKKRLEKACGKRKSFLHLHPEKRGKSIERSGGKLEKGGEKKASKIF